MTKTASYWTTIDFRPAPSGWRTAYLVDEEPGFITIPMPGWLVQEEVLYNIQTGQDLDKTGHRRVIAGDFDGAEVVEADASNLWCVLSPDTPEPTAEDVRRAKQERP
jgi:hypothetical protein